MTADEKVYSTDVDDLKTFAGGLRALYAEGHLQDWRMSLVNDLRWKCQVVRKCCHPDFADYLGGPPARLAWAYPSPWPFDLAGAYLHYEEAHELFYEALDDKVCPLRTVEALKFLDWPCPQRPLAFQQLEEVVRPTRAKASPAELDLVWNTVWA